jgi:conserved hypothetical protein
VINYLIEKRKRNMKNNNDIDNKYEITDIVGYRFKKKVYRIRALKDFSDVKKGDLGGFVSSYKNLSQDGDCWIYDDGSVIQNAMALEDSKIKGNAIIYDNVEICGKSIIEDSCWIYGRSFITNSHISGKCRLYNTKVNKSRLRGYILDIIDGSVITNSYIRGCLYLKSSDINKTHIIADEAHISNRTYISYSKLRLFRDSEIYKSYICNLSIIRAYVRLNNTQLITTEVINNKEKVYIKNKNIECGYIGNTNDVISFSLDLHDDRDEYTISLYKNRNGDIIINYRYRIYKSIDRLISCINASDKSIEILRYFDSIAKEYFNIK